MSVRANVSDHRFVIEAEAVWEPEPDPTPREHGLTEEESRRRVEAIEAEIAAAERGEITAAVGAANINFDARAILTLVPREPLTQQWQELDREVMRQFRERVAGLIGVDPALSPADDGVSICQG